ncbi:MAG: class I SAM-dependent methyltransferase [Verrucomicrobiota bacterium]
MPTPDDHFSAIANEYAAGRISYPAALYQFLLSQVPAATLAWDAATGTGQAAEDLSRHFHKVIATDISNNLLGKADPNPKIEYKNSPSEKTDLPSDAATLITVAQAIHWFEFEAFWKEVDRVLAPQGILAFWGYCWPQVTKPVDVTLEGIRNILGPYWPPRSQYLHNHYEELRPPFEEIEAPKLELSESWTAENYMSHLKSWSGVRYHKEQTKTDLVSDYEPRIRHLWGSTARPVTWPLILKVYRKRSS